MQRYFPNGAVIVRPKGFEGVEIGLYSNSKNGKVGAIAYGGKRRKPDFYFQFDNTTRREAYIAEYLKGLEKTKQHKEDRKANRKLESNPIKVGDIFYASWGWEQTNIDFYGVTEVNGMFITLIELKQEREYTGDMSGNCWPTRAPKENAQPIRKKVLTHNSGESVYVNLNSFTWCGQWDGKPKGWTSYA